MLVLCMSHGTWSMLDVTMAAVNRVCITHGQTQHSWRAEPHRSRAAQGERR